MRKGEVCSQSRNSLGKGPGAGRGGQYVKDECALWLECSEWRAVVGDETGKGAEVRSMQFSTGSGEPLVVLSSIILSKSGPGRKRGRLAQSGAE